MAQDPQKKPALVQAALTTPIPGCHLYRRATTRDAAAFLVHWRNAKNDEVTTFSLKAQMLDQGRTDTVLAATDDLSVRLKVYASGGENGLHAHVDEDHVFGQRQSG